jgi:hypothetical protein
MLLPSRDARHIAVALLAALLLAWVPASHAGTYHHLGLNTGATSNTDGFTASVTDKNGGISATLAPTQVYSEWAPYVRGTFYAGEATRFRYSAAPNTSITNVHWTHRLSGFTGGDWNLLISDASGYLHVEVPAVNTEVAWSTAATGSYVDFLYQCGGPYVCNSSGGRGVFAVDYSDVTLSDPYTPTAGAPGGTLVDGSPGSRITGSVDISYNASDAGSGLYRTSIYDGASLVSSQVVDSNGGHCADITGSRSFDRRVPCVLAGIASATLNTAALADGAHVLRAVLSDASGNTFQVWTGTRTIANHPPALASAPSFDAPSVAAKPVPGTELVASPGAWTGPNLNYVYAWQRCDAQGGACAQIPGASTLKYVPTSDDVGHRLRLAVTATNPADSVTSYTNPTGLVAAPSSAGDTTIKDPPANGTDGTDGTNGTNGTNGDHGVDGGTGSPPVVGGMPPLPSPPLSNTTQHIFVGRVAGEPAGVGCPGDKATLKFQHIKGAQLKLGYGKAATVQAELTCTQSGKAIVGGKLEIATKTGTHPTVASDMTTDGDGHAVLRIAKGASRSVTVGYRMFADDPIARAVSTMKVLVNARVSFKSNHKTVHNGHAVTFKGVLAGAEIPRRGVTLSMQWRDGKKWRPFAQIKTNKKGSFSYAYRFTRTRKTLHYRFRVQIDKGQLDYPFQPIASKSLTVTVGR